jgi:hypothetical protein
MSYRQITSRRRDENEPAIKDWLQSHLDCLVIPVDSAGIGDLLVAFKVRPRAKIRHLGLLEVKSASGKLNPLQIEFAVRAQRLRIPYAVVHDIAEAEAVLEQWRKERR